MTLWMRLALRHSAGRTLGKSLNVARPALNRTVVQCVPRCNMRVVKLRVVKPWLISWFRATLVHAMCKPLHIRDMSMTSVAVFLHASPLLCYE